MEFLNKSYHQRQSVKTYLPFLDYDINGNTNFRCHDENQAKDVLKGNRQIV